MTGNYHKKGQSLGGHDFNTVAFGAGNDFLNGHLKICFNVLINHVIVIIVVFRFIC